MEEWQERVIEEARELRDNIQKLSVFLLSYIFAALNREERDLMLHQHEVMTHYYAILAQRIAIFKRREIPDQSDE